MGLASNLWTERIGRPATLGLMVGCIGVSCVALGERLVPAWDGAYLLIFCSLTAVETYFSIGLIRHAPHRMWLQLVEWLLLFLALSICVDVAQGWPLLGNAGLPTVHLLTVGIFIPVGLTHEVVRLTMQDLEQLGEMAQDDRHGSPQHRLARRIFGGGVVLFLVAGATQDNVASVLRLPGGGSGPILNVLLYFVLGTLFLAQVHYTALRGRWFNQNIDVVSQIGRSWLFYTLVFVGAVALSAILLSAITSHATGFASMGRAVWDPTLRAAVRSGAISKHLLLQLLKMFGGSTDLLRGTRPTKTLLPPGHLNFHLSPPNALTSHAAHDAKHVSHGNALFNLIERLVFWVLLAACLLLVMRTAFDRSARTRGAAKRIDGMLSTLVSAWLTIWGWFRRNGLPANPLSVARRERNGRSGVQGLRARWSSSAPTSPREQILQYYHSMTKEAARKGMSRQPAQTPAEYLSVLSARVPEVTGGAALLTSAFVEAKYSGHEVERSQVIQAGEEWSRVRAALRRLRT